MADTAYEDKRIRDEAAGWYAKLNNTTISTQTLRDFRAWRNADERCAIAYREIEAFWQRAAKVQYDPAIQRAVGEALAREKTGLGPLPRLGPRGLAGIAVILALGASAIVAWPAVMGRAYQTEVGEQRFVRLEDGSRLRLDTDSKVRVRFTGRRRAIELVGGRAFFDVAHDASRPFVVTAGDASVTALGTRFSVLKAQDGAEVMLLQGQVRVTGGTAAKSIAWTLQPGDRIETGRAEPKVEPVDPAVATSWMAGHLTFRQSSLGEAVEQVNRYSDHKVVLDDPALAERQISGVFDAGDTEAFAAAVAELYQLRTERQGRTLRLTPAA